MEVIMWDRKARARLVVALAAIGGAACSVSAGEVYAVNHLASYPDSGPDTLIRFDSGNPAAFVTVGSLGVNNVGFGGLDFDRAGGLWAYATFNKFTSGASSGLYRVDPNTGAATVQGALSTQTLTDLAFNPADGVMYGVFSQGYAVSRLYAVNLQSGAVSVVGVFSGLPSEHNLVGLAADSAGAFYVHDNIHNVIYKASATLQVTPLYDFSTIQTTGSQGLTIDWSRNNLGYHGAVGQGEFPNYFSQVNTFALDGSSYVWGPDFGPNHPDGIPPVQAGDLAIRPALGCYANCDGSTAAPTLNVADFSCFLLRFAAADPYANCDGSVAPPVLNVADFSCFLQKFAAGCP
jgi:hypothetical protein